MWDIDSLAFFQGFDAGLPGTTFSTTAARVLSIRAGQCAVSEGSDALGQETTGDNG